MRAWTLAQSQNATTKGALVTYSQALSRMLAARGIRVNVVAPGPVWTLGWRGLAAKSFAFDFRTTNGVAEPIRF